MKTKEQIKSQFREWRKHNRRIGIMSSAISMDELAEFVIYMKEEKE